MSNNETENNRRNKLFNIFAVIWISGFIATAVFLPVLSLTPKGRTFNFLETIFLTIGMTMLTLSFVIVILGGKWHISQPCIPEVEDMHWSIIALIAFLLACVLSASPVFHTTQKALTISQMITLFGIYMLPFLILAIIVPAVVKRVSSADNYRKARKIGYATAMIIAFATSLFISPNTLSFVFLLFFMLSAVSRRMKNRSMIG